MDMTVDMHFSESAKQTGEFQPDAIEPAPATAQESQRGSEAHLCLVAASTAELESGLAAFLGRGLTSGARCLLVGPETIRRRLVRALRERGIDASQELQKGALVLLRTAQLARASGARSVAPLVACLERLEQEALEAGFTGLRVSWQTQELLADDGPDEVLAFEEELERRLQGASLEVLCQYPRGGARPTDPSRALRLHPQVMLGDAVCSNPFYEPAEVRHGKSGAQVEWRLSELRRAQSAERLFAEVKQSLADKLEELDVVSAARAELLAKLAHELRGPLASVSNALAVLSHAAGSEHQRQRSLAAAERQVRHQAELIDSLLDADRVVYGQVALDRSRLDLVELAREVVADEEDAALTLDLGSEPLPVYGDRERLRQVLQELLDNARKFGEEPILVRAHRGSDGWAEIAVEDSGPGFPAQLLPHVWELFAQQPQSLARQHGGLGVGLAIVKGLIALHGGEVEAHNHENGHGSVISFRLPAEASANPVASVRRGQLLRVLIVEDSVDAGETLRDLLELDGRQVELAATGPDAVSSAHRFLPGVVLCDLGLPGMSGYEVAAALRGDPATACVELIAVTGYGGREDRERSRAAGFDHHLTKPVDTRELRRLLLEAEDR